MQVHKSQRQVRFGYHELERFVTAHFGADDDLQFDSTSSDGRRQTDTRMALLTTGTEQRTTIVRWRKEGLAYWRAERVAAELGYHPSEIWPFFDTYRPHIWVIAPQEEDHLCS